MKICFMAGRENISPFRLSPEDSAKWGTIEATSNPNEADYFVVLEGWESPRLRQLPKNKVICFPSEPDAIKKSKKYNMYNFKYVFNYKSHYHLVTALFFMGGTYDSYKQLAYPVKTKQCSAVMSKKGMTQGHKLRKKFLSQFCNKYPELIDVYGRGWNNNDLPGYKGQLAIRNNNGRPTKFDGLIKYKYSICCENSEEHNVFSEKLTDAFLTWTIPIFYGTANIGDFFPKDSFYQFHPEDPDACEKVKAIIEKPVTEANIKALEIARNLCLDRYNIWPSVERVVNFLEEHKTAIPDKGIDEYKMYRYIDHL